MTTQLNYLFRDGANYKEFGSFLLAGDIDGEQAATIWSNCESGKFFVAEQVGIPSLRERMIERSGPSAEDHGWHELVSLEAVNDDRPCAMTVTDMVERFVLICQWRPQIAI